MFITLPHYSFEQRAYNEADMHRERYEIALASMYGGLSNTDHSLPQYQTTVDKSSFLNFVEAARDSLEDTPPIALPKTTIRYSGWTNPWFLTELGRGSVNRVKLSELNGRPYHAGMSRERQADKHLSHAGGILIVNEVITLRDLSFTDRASASGREAAVSSNRLIGLRGIGELIFPEVELDLIKTGSNVEFPGSLTGHFTIACNVGSTQELILQSHLGDKSNYSLYEATPKAVVF